MRIIYTLALATISAAVSYAQTKPNVILILTVDSDNAVYQLFFFKVKYNRFKSFICKVPELLISNGNSISYLV